MYPSAALRHYNSCSTTQPRQIHGIPQPCMCKGLNGNCEISQASSNGNSKSANCGHQHGRRAYLPMLLLCECISVSSLRAGLSSGGFEHRDRRGWRRRWMSTWTARWLGGCQSTVSGLATGREWLSEHGAGLLPSGSIVHETLMQRIAQVSKSCDVQIHQTSGKVSCDVQNCCLSELFPISAK